MRVSTINGSLHNPLGARDAESALQHVRASHLNGGRNPDEMLRRIDGGRVNFIEALKARLPAWAKDLRLNLDAVLLRSALTPEQAAGVALAAAFASADAALVASICDAGVLAESERAGCLTAASLMAMNSIWYPYLAMAGNADLSGQPAQLRMNAYASHGGISKLNFAAYALAAAIVGKCPHGVKSHHDTLRGEGLTLLQLRDVGRIAAVVAAASRVAAMGDCTAVRSRALAG